MFRIKNFISKLLRKVAGLLNDVSNKISLQPLPQQAPLSLQAMRVKPWQQAEGDKTLRLDYDLNENSIVMDMGGYEGQWAADVFCRYNCNIHIFEPHPEYTKNITARFKNNNKVTVYTYGLSKHNSTEKLFIAADSSSTFKSSSEGITIELKKVDDFLIKLPAIDLIKINIEGGEYDLLEHLIATNLIIKFNNIQVQFHDFVPEAETRMKAIQNKLQQRHELTYQYEYVWENWKLKQS